MAEFSYSDAILNAEPEPKQKGFSYSQQILSEQPMGGEMTQSGEWPQFEQVETGDMGLMESAKEMWTGDQSRQFNYPEIPVLSRARVENETSWGPKGKITSSLPGAMSYARGNDLGRAQIFKHFVPEANIEFDEFGNPYTDYYGEPMYLNRPGASPADAVEVGNIIVPEIAAATAAGKIGRAMGGMPGQMAGAGAALGGLSLAHDKIAEVMGSEQDTDWKRAQLMAAFGAGGEAGGLLLGKLFQTIKNSRSLMTPEGKLTDRGRKILERNGIDPDVASKDFLDDFTQRMRENVDPDVAVASAEAQSLPKPVPLTRAQQTRDVVDQRLEQNARMGTMGEEAKGVIDEFDIRQDTALRDNREAIQARIGGREDGTPGVSALGDGMETAQRSLLAKRKAMHRQMKAAYDQADNLGMKFERDGLKVIYDHMRNALETFPAESAAMKEISRLRQTIRSPKGAPRVQALSLRSMENLRSRLSSIARGGATQQEKEAARQAVQAYDEGVRAAVEQAAYRGDINALRAFERGRTGRAAIGNMFEKDKLVSRIVETDIPGQKGQLILPPDEAANVLFTGSALKGAKGSEAALKRIRKILLDNGNEQAWNRLKEESVFRLFRTLDSADIGQNVSQRGVSGRKFANALDKAFVENRRLMNVLFTPQEQQLLRQFRNTLVRATQPVRGAVNYSGTSYNNAQLLAEYGRRLFGPASRLVSDVLESLNKNWRAPGANARRAQEATGGGLPRGAAPPGPRVGDAYGGFGAAAAAQTPSTQERLDRRGRRRLQR